MGGGKLGGAGGVGRWWVGVVRWVGGWVDRLGRWVVLG